ncbi:MAG: DUF4249 domain-containing protein [Bacteroidota bacterium]
MKFLKSNIFPFLSALLLFASSCTDVIDVETDPADSQLVVDAWINDLMEPQSIRLTQSQAYFDNSFSDGVTNATVMIESSEGTTFEFVHEAEGRYVWTPSVTGELGAVGTSFVLTIELDGETYTSETTLFDAPPVDSITQEFRDDQIGGPDGIYTEFFARDLPGLGNTYWIKTFKNGAFLNKPQEMNLAYDAAFDAGGEIDGLIFIPPIREATNRVADDDGDDDNDVPPWEPGDEIRVEIHSISNAAHDFMSIAQEQMTNGDNTIFAIPLANTTSNVANAATGERVLGFFNVAKVTSLTKMIE